MKVDRALVDEANIVAERRHARDPNGDCWAGAAAMYASDGRVLASVFVGAPNAAAALCCETGASAEPHKLNLAIAASVRVARERPEAPFVILTPCGICEERLAFWGNDVQVGVPHPGDATRWLSKPQRRQAWAGVPEARADADPLASLSSAMPTFVPVRAGERSRSHD